MSKPAPSPQSNIIQLLLILALAFLGTQLLMNSQNSGAADTRTAAAVYTKLEELHRDLKDLTIATEVHAYEKKVRDEGTKAKRPAAEIEADIFRGQLLVADTQYLTGLAYPDQALTKINRAYATLKTQYEKYFGTPAWTDVSIKTSTDGKSMDSSTSAAQLYPALVDDLSQRNKKDLVYGFVPGYDVIDTLVRVTGSQPGLSYWLAALLLALVVRSIIWPFAQKQLMWGRQMQQLQPFVKELEAKHKDKKTGQVKDQQAFSQDTMKLYQEYGINPFSGCGPALVQLPLFLTVYQCMLHYRFEFTKGLFLWIHPGSGSIGPIHLAPNLGEKDNILIAIYGISMVVSTLMMPVSDYSQVQKQKLMGIGISLAFSIGMFFYPLPSAFVLYWIFTNILSTTQSLISYRLPAPPLQKKMTSEGGLLPIDAIAKNGHATEHVDHGFFGKTGTTKANKTKKIKK